MSNYLKTEKLSDLQNKINKGIPVILKIGHNGCPPCIKIAPVIKKVAQSVPDITFIDYDISFFKTRPPTPEEDYFLNNLKFRSVPHFIMYYNGLIYNHNSPSIYALIRAEDSLGLKDLLPKVNNSEGAE